MKSTLKLLLIVVLFCGTAMAGEMVGGGFAPVQDPPEAETTKIPDTILIYVSELVVSFLG